MIWRMFLNDKEPDCGAAACCNAILLWGTATPTDADAQIANNRFSSADYNSKVLWGWFDRGIAGNKLGGFAKIGPKQIPTALRLFGCVILFLSTFQGVGPHAVLLLRSGAVVSWDKEYPDFDLAAIEESYVISPKWNWRFPLWAVMNTPRWLFFLSPLWW